MLSGVEDRIHVVLVDPAGKDGVSHTLSYADGQWSVDPGLIGTAQRTFRMNARQALDYQRHAYSAMKASSAAGWIAFGSWYKEWRESCSTVSG